MLNNHYKFTDELIIQAKKIDIPKTYYNGQSYSLSEITNKFRTAFTEPEIRKIFLSFCPQGQIWNFASLGFCKDTSFALQILFPKLSIYHTADNCHFWNIYKSKIFDITADQFQKIEALKYYEHGKELKNINLNKLNNEQIKRSHLFIKLALNSNEI